MKISLPHRRRREILRAGVTILASLGCAEPAWAWGNEGHEIVGEGASHFLVPAARQRVMALLATDTDPLAAHDLVSETTWANVDRIFQFATELRSSTTVEGERRVALEFLLHFVGDIHQPLHSSDANDSGGNMEERDRRRARQRQPARLLGHAVRREARH